MTDGFIKIHRKIVEWEWYKDIPTKTLFLHLLLTANYEVKKWQGHVIGPGSLVTSLRHLSKETGLTLQQVRRVLEKLKVTHEITHKTTSRNSIITIKNWDEYQTNSTQNNKQTTHKQHTNNTNFTKLITNKQHSPSPIISTDSRIDENENNTNLTIENPKMQQQLKNKEYNTTLYRVCNFEENCKNIKNDENIKICGEYNNVCLLNSQYMKLVGICASEKLLNEIIEAFSRNIETGKEKPYMADLPNAHYERLRSYYNYRVKHPQRFNGKQKKQEEMDYYEVVKAACEKVQQERGI